MKNDKKEISQIGLGLSQLNNSLYKKKKFSINDISTLIEYAIEKGIKYFDTAHNYGETEKILGKLNKNIKKKIHIFTKGGLKLNEQRDFSQPYLRRKIINSLKNLQIESIDTFFLNKPTYKEIKENDLFNFFYKLRKKGIVKNFGIIVGNDKLNNLVYKNEDIKFYSFMYNLLNIDDEKYIKLAKKNEKIVITRSPFNSGLLTNNFSQNLTFSKTDFRFEYFSGKNFDLKKNKILELQKNLKIKKNLFLSSYYFLRQNKFIDIILFGSHSKKQIKNICLPNKNFFRAEELKMIKKKIKKLNSFVKTNDQKN